MGIAPASASGVRVAAGVVLLFAVALGLRLAYLGQLHDTPFADERPLVRDAAYYDMRAREVAAGDLVGEAPAYLSPLTGDALGVVYALFGPGLPAAKTFQALLGALSCVLLARIGARVFSEAVGWLAGASLAAYGLHVYYTGLLLPPVLVVFVNLLFVWVALGAAREPSLPRFLGSGLVIGLAAAAKSNGLLLLPVAWSWIALGFRGIAPRRRLGWCAALGAGAVLAIAPFTARNFAASGQRVLLTTSGGLNLLKGNGPDADGSHVFLPRELGVTHLEHYLGHRVDPRRAVAEDRALARRALAYVLEHPGRSVALAGRKLALLVNAHELGIRDQYYFARTQIPLLAWPWLGFGVLAPLGITGAILAWRERTRASLLLYGVLLAQVVSFTLVFVLARYRLVAVACLAPFAAWQILRWAQSLRTRRGRGMAPSLALLALVAAAVHAPLPGLSRERGFADQWAFLGDHHYERGERDEALRLYREALRAPWQNEAGGKRRARILRRLGEDPGDGR